MVAGIAAFIEAHSHRPIYGCPHGAPECSVGEGHYLRPGSLSQTPYDVLRIGGWALVIFGALLVIVGLIAFARKGQDESSA